MLRLSDLAYLGRQREEYPISGLLDEALYGQPPAQQNYPMLLAQAGTAGTQKMQIETDPELYGPRPVAPSTPQGGGYKTGSDYVIRPPNHQQLDEFQRRAREEAERNLRRRR